MRVSPNVLILLVCTASSVAYPTTPCGTDPECKCVSTPCHDWDLPPQISDPMCSHDTRQCLDGSFVKRDSSNGCKFHPCIAPKACPLNCKLYFDGCNTCRCNAGKLGGCTKKTCPLLASPSCKVEDAKLTDSREAYDAEGEGRQLFFKKNFRATDSARRLWPVRRAARRAGRRAGRRTARRWCRNAFGVYGWYCH